MLNRFALAALAAACLPLVAQAHDGDHAAAEDNRIVVVRDAETGQLRVPTADEMAALASKRSKLSATRISASQVPLPKVHASGARGARLTDEMASYSVAVRRPDGSISMQCVQGKTEAENLLKSGQVTAQSDRVEE